MRDDRVSGGIGLIRHSRPNFTRLDHDLILGTALSGYSIWPACKTIFRGDLPPTYRTQSPWSSRTNIYEAVAYGCC